MSPKTQSSMNKGESAMSTVGGDLGQLEPGRELDTLVAEKVMGWRKGDWKKDWGDGSKAEYFDIWLMPEGELPSYRCSTPPRFSTDIAEAWRVVEKLKNVVGNEGFTLGYCLEHYIETGEELWEVHAVVLMDHILDGNGWGDPVDEVWAATAPHAICLAALKAVSVQPASASQD